MQRRQDGTGPEDILLTGSNGFLGSQFITAWLQRHCGARAGCLIRASDDASAESRLRAAMLRAGEDRDALAGLGSAIERAQAIRGDLGPAPADGGEAAGSRAPPDAAQEVDPRFGGASAIADAIVADDIDWLDGMRRWRDDGHGRPFRVLHCAANLSFRPADRSAVRAVNIDGTHAMLEAARRLGASEFNYVSTAYVAGDREGDILEDEVDEHRPGFSNAYEESKWDAEALVRSYCTAHGMPYRILRPSIIIGHSVTYRLSALSGFYKVIETVRALGRLPQARGRNILLPIPAGASLDLIPVDWVVSEMIQVLEAGDATVGHAFHLTSDSPLPLVPVLAALSPLAGLTIGRLDEQAGPADRLAELMMQRLRHYAPYLGQVRSFDRRNVREAGIAPQPTLDIDRLRPYVTGFISRAA